MSEHTHSDERDTEVWMSALAGRPNKDAANLSQNNDAGALRRAVIADALDAQWSEKELDALEHRLISTSKKPKTKARPFWLQISVAANILMAIFGALVIPQWSTGIYRGDSLDQKVESIQKIFTTESYLNVPVHVIYVEQLENQTLELISVINSSGGLVNVGQSDPNKYLLRIWLPKKRDRAVLEKLLSWDIDPSEEKISISFERIKTQPATGD